MIGGVTISLPKSALILTTGYNPLNSLNSGKSFRNHPILLNLSLLPDSKRSLASLTVLSNKNPRLGAIKVATAPTVYGIETNITSFVSIQDKLQQHLPFTVLKL